MKDVVISEDGEVIETRQKRLNLHNIEATLREMKSVYRDMRNGVIQSQDGTRLIYVLKEIVNTHKLKDLNEAIEPIKTKELKPSEILRELIESKELDNVIEDVINGEYEIYSTQNNEERARLIARKKLILSFINSKDGEAYRNGNFFAIYDYCDKLKISELKKEMAEIQNELTERPKLIERLQREI